MIYIIDVCVYSVTDLANNKRRLFLSTTQKETHVAATLHARVPLTIMKRHKVQYC